MTLLIMVISLLLLLALRVPVSIALLIPSLGYVLMDPSVRLGTAVQQTVSGVDSFSILAVPMFILLGNLANVSGVTDKLYDAAVAAIGHLRGSLGYVNVATSFGFSFASHCAMVSGLDMDFGGVIVAAIEAM